LAKKSVDEEKRNRLKAIEKAPERFYGRDPVIHYQMHLKRLKSESGGSMSYSKEDYLIAKDLAKKRYTKDELVKALSEASPEAAARKMIEHDYVQRTVDRVFKDPEVKKIHQRSRGHDMGR